METEKHFTENASLAERGGAICSPNQERIKGCRMGRSDKVFLFGMCHY